MRVVTVDSGGADVPIIDMEPVAINRRFMRGLRWRRNKLATRSWAILCGMGSDASRMAYRHIWDECGAVMELNAKSLCTGSVLKSGV